MAAKPIASEFVDWIAVSDTLPDDGETVLIACPEGGGEPVWFGFLEDGRWCDANDGAPFEEGVVTAWAPMLVGPA